MGFHRLWCIPRDLMDDIGRIVTRTSSSMVCPLVRLPVDLNAQFAHPIVIFKWPNLKQLGPPHCVDLRVDTQSLSSRSYHGCAVSNTAG